MRKYETLPALSFSAHKKRNSERKLEMQEEGRNVVRLKKRERQGKPRYERQRQHLSGMTLLSTNSEFEHTQT